jgi:hypothetical protein
VPRLVTDDPEVKDQAGTAMAFQGEFLHAEYIYNHLPWHLKYFDSLGIHITISLRAADRMFRHLSQFVSYRSISNEEHREECRQAALYLKTTLVKLGLAVSYTRDTVFNNHLKKERKRNLICLT